MARGTLRWLNREVVGCEVKKAAFQLGANKAPGSDGIPAAFIQRYWGWVGESITQFVLKVFKTEVVPVEMNKSVICLLPKQKNQEDITQFRLICLSNVIARFVDKVIANRVKVFIGDLT